MLQKGYLPVKSLIDTCMAGAGLVMLSPLMAGIAAAIKLEEGPKAPVLFEQDRIGIDQKHFTMYKFRSMSVNTPKNVPTHLLEDPDQYITRVGRLLRKYSLDELPQLINILRGDMAVIGPRPALWNQYDLMEEREKYGVHQVKPGLTGFAQIHGRDELEIPDKAKLDGIYVRHFGPLIDFVCFFDSIFYVLKGEGVVEGGTGAMNREANSVRPATDKGRKKPRFARAGRHQAARSGNSGKKILMMTNHSYMFYRFRKELVSALAEENEVVLSMPFVGHEDDFAAMGIRCIETDIDRRGIDPHTDFGLVRHYARILRTEKPDLVITYSIKPNIYAGLLCSLRGIPYFANVQGLGTAFQDKKLAALVTVLYKTAFRRVKKVFFENQANADEFCRRGIVKADREVVLNGAGINLEEFQIQPYPANEPVHFLFLSRIMREKGVDELFAAAERLHKEGAEFVLDLVGFFEDEYKEKVERLEQAGIVRFHGFQEQPIPFYAAADCVVMPSWHEGMSNVNLEASALGRPVITTDIPGCREAVDDGVTGYLCRVKDADSLYGCMKKVLQMTAEERRLMGLAGREKMQREFGKEMIVGETMEALGM